MMTAKPSNQSGENDRTREKILDAALDVFGRRGYTGATTREIASKAKVNEVTLFRKFGSKKSLFLAVFEERFPLPIIRESIVRLPTGTVDNLLYQNATTVLRTLRSNKQMLRVMFSDAWKMPDTRKIFSEAVAKRGMGMASEVFNGLMSAGAIKKMDPKIASRALVGMIQSYFLMNDLFDVNRVSDEEEERMIRGFVSIFLDGVRIREEAGTE
ncbi:MAG: TetR/AcrR family transcriptional regulator [Thermoplasmata archaeon]|nr:TetR/AcrR family transcriptional regulator [Thermoplasmata archaeon]